MQFWLLSFRTGDLFRDHRHQYVHPDGHFCCYIRDPVTCHASAQPTGAGANLGRLCCHIGTAVAGPVFGGAGISTRPLYQYEFSMILAFLARLFLIRNNVFVVAYPWDPAGSSVELPPALVQWLFLPDAFFAPSALVLIGKAHLKSVNSRDLRKRTALMSSIAAHAQQR